MTKALHALAIASAVLAAPSASAAKVFAYEADVNVTSGNLLGETFSARFIADLGDLAGVDEEFLPVSSLRFDFGGEVYTETDGDPEVAYFDGDFLGLSYSVETPDTFSFVPGFFGVEDAFFAYEGLSSDGVGDVSYSVAPVPLPAALPMLLAGLGGLFLLRRRG